MICILTGPVHSGKTTLLEKLVNELKTEDFKLNGFLSRAIWKNKVPLGYDLFDLKEERSIPFIRRIGKEGWEKIGSYFLIPQSLAEAKKIILRTRDADILVVDEFGPLELREKGLWPSLKQVLSQAGVLNLLVVRATILEKFLEKISASDVIIFDIRDTNIFHRLKKTIIQGAHHK